MLVIMGKYLPETCRYVEINILKSSVNLVGSILKIVYMNVGQQNMKFSWIKYDYCFNWQKSLAGE